MQGISANNHLKSERDLAVSEGNISQASSGERYFLSLTGKVFLKSNC